MGMKDNFMTAILSFITLFHMTCSLKLLMIPIDYGFNSRIMNMGNMGKMLTEHHDVHFLISEGMFDRYTPPKELKLIKIEKPENARYITDQDFLDEIEEATANSYFNPIAFTRVLLSLCIPWCEKLLSSTDIMQHLKELNFDVIMVDNYCECCRLVVDYLDKPVIVYSNFGYASMPEIFYPNLPSFVCDPMLPPCNSDTMDFQTRMGNFFQRVFVSYYSRPTITSRFDELRFKYNINTTLKSIDSFKKALAFVQVSPVLHYPRPTMPHVIPISGYVHKWAKPLTPEITNLIEKSKYDCTVVVSFGTLAPQDDIKRVTEMAEILGQLDALIIWKYTGGERPKNSAVNIHFVRWFPQSAVLQHPKTCLFLTHAGISGTYEAVHAAVPVVALPYFADQDYNSEILVTRLKMGVKDSLIGYTKKSLSKAVKAVYKNPEYRKNARHAKEMIEHQMIEPEMQILYWIEHIAKFGTSHLISKPAYELNIFQFYSVDVIVFLLFLFVLIIFVLVSSVAWGIYLFKKCISRKDLNVKKNK